MLSARTTRPPMANTSLHAFAAAIAPKSAGSSTRGGKKSVVETKARPSARRRTAASSKGANPTSSPAEADRPPSISRTSADSGEPPHFAAQPPHEVHSVSFSAPSAIATARVSQDCQDHERVTLEPGAKVEVRTAFDRSWARGFEVEAVTDEGYRLRRLSDG